MHSKIYVSADNVFKVLDLRKEYKDYSEDIPYAIVTDLDEEDLIDEYGDVIDGFYPYVLLTNDMYQAMRESFLNDDRERKRDYLFHDAFAMEVGSYLIDEMVNPVRICESLFNMDELFRRMRELPDHQGSRVYRHYVVGFSIREIAEQDDVYWTAIYQSIHVAKPKIHDIFVELGVAA